jgi:hypothetical protein
VKAKLLALAIGLALIGTAFLFGKSAPQQSAEEQEDLKPVHSPVPRQKPGLFQTVSFHPSDFSAPITTQELPALDSKAAAKHWNQVSSLVNCASQAQGCPEDLPESDPSSKFFALRDRILDELDWFNSHQSTSAAQSARVIEAAHMMLAMPDEEIQCRSLDALLLQPPSSKTPALIAKNMSELVDADCVQKVVKVMRRSLDDSNLETITNYACETILHGAVLSSKEMANSVGLLITDATRSRLEACMAKLPKSERFNSMQKQLYPASAI